MSNFSEDYPLTTKAMKEIGADSNIMISESEHTSNLYAVFAIAKGQEPICVADYMSESVANILRNILIQMQGTYSYMENKDCIFHKPQAD